MKTIFLIALLLGGVQVIEAKPEISHQPWFSAQKTAEAQPTLKKSRRGLIKSTPRRNLATKTNRVKHVRRATRVRAAEPEIIHEKIDTQSTDAPNEEAPVEEISKPSEDEAQEDPGNAVARQAMRYRGSDYVFGGKSKDKGFDCSGFVLRIFNDLKLRQLPHTSSAIYQHGRNVRLSELRAGDLVFFRNTYKRGISHVGIYVGRNKFIHASNSRKGVIITPLSDTYYQLRYAGARRLY